MSFFFQPNGFFGAPQQAPSYYNRSPYGSRPQPQQQPPRNRGHQQQQYVDSSSEDEEYQPQQLVRLRDGSLAYRPVATAKQQQRANQQAELQRRRQAEEQRQRELELEREREKAAKLEHQRRLAQMEQEQQQRQQQEHERLLRQQQQLEQEQAQKRSRHYEKPSDFWSSLFEQPKDSKKDNKKDSKKDKKGKKEKKHSKSSKHDESTQAPPQPPQPQPKPQQQPRPAPQSAPLLTPMALTKASKSINATIYKNNAITPEVKTTVCDEIQDETTDLTATDSSDNDETFSFPSDAPLIVDIEPDANAMSHHSAAIDKILTGWETAPFNKIASQPIHSNPTATRVSKSVQQPQQPVTEAKTTVEPQKVEIEQAEKQPAQTSSTFEPLSTSITSQPAPKFPEPSSQQLDNSIESINDSHLEKLMAQTKALYARRSAALSKIKALTPSNPFHASQLTSLQKTIKQIDAMIEQTHQATEELLSNL